MRYPAPDYRWLLILFFIVALFSYLDARSILIETNRAIRSMKPTIHMTTQPVKVIHTGLPDPRYVK